jgi:hypothetical protein
MVRQKASANRKASDQQDANVTVQAWQELLGVLWSEEDLKRLDLQLMDLAAEACSCDPSGELHVPVPISRDEKYSSSVDSRRDLASRRVLIRYLAKQLVQRVERALTYQRSMDDEASAGIPRAAQIAMEASSVNSAAESLQATLKALHPKLGPILEGAYAGAEVRRISDRALPPIDWEILLACVRSLSEAAASVAKDFSGRESRGRPRRDSLRATARLLRLAFRTARLRSGNSQQDQPRSAEDVFVKMALEAAGIDTPSLLVLHRDYRLDE